MTLLTVEEARSELKEVQFAGGAILPSFAAVIYGGVELFRHGVELGAWPSTYLPLFGGLTAIIAIPVYAHAVKAPAGRLWSLAAGPLGAVIPYLFSLYVMAFLGVWTAYRALTAHPLAWGHALVGAFWLLVGWRMFLMLRRLQAHLSQTPKAAAGSASTSAEAPISAAPEAGAARLQKPMAASQLKSRRRLQGEPASERCDPA